MFPGGRRNGLISCCSLFKILLIMILAVFSSGFLFVKIESRNYKFKLSFINFLRWANFTTFWKYTTRLQISWKVSNNILRLAGEKCWNDLPRRKCSRSLFFIPLYKVRAVSIKYFQTFPIFLVHLLLIILFNVIISFFLMTKCLMGGQRASF